MRIKKEFNLQRKHFFYTLAICVVAGTVLYGTAWGLVMTTNVTRDVPFLKKLFITQYGDFSSNHKVDLDENGIRIYGTEDDGHIIRSPRGQLTFVGQLTGGSFSDKSIKSDDIKLGSLQMEDFGIPMVTTVSLPIVGTCPTGEVMIGVTNGTPDCLPVSGVGPNPTGTISATNCAPGFIQEITSTGRVVCDPGSQVGNGNGIWHNSTTILDDIFYGTLVDDNDGNIGIGLDSPLTKLHVYSSVSGFIAYTPSVFIHTGGAVSSVPNICPYVSGLPITSPLCFRHHGICGTANGQSFGSTPATNLCALGNPSAVAGNGPWSRTCLGVNGGNNSPTCTASLSTNGQCGSANGSTYRSAPTPQQRCNVGTPQITSVYAAGTTYHEQWVCQGINGGTNSTTCTGYPVTAGMCGNLSQVGSTQNPVNGNADLCEGTIQTNNTIVVGASIGAMTTLPGNPLTKTWYCNGYNGGPSSLECKTSYYNGSNTRLHAECGTATQSGPLSSPPTTNLCGYVNTATLAGGVNTVTAPNGIQWYQWSCSAPGKNTSNCYAPKQ